MLYVNTVLSKIKRFAMYEIGSLHRMDVNIRNFLPGA